ncbi:zonular occludens toxin domain-containing protein [Dyella sp. S184]|uniref:zonular occludens toxin domain-containing protein n=1 Tax=Dyella sp. S184 TaxID=1641862 RepID=UPI00131CF683|nr:zonular occludens toxin domain-containing protein [Dyella sp. S184]
MPVTLLTGLPGSGKTAQLVKRIVDLQQKEPGRPVFQMGINGLKPGLASDLTMEQLEHWWEELPPGSIICLDECQEDHLMPKDRGNPAPWVQKITKVRHFGMDFILTTQHPANMSAYVRRLVDNHVHSIMRSKGVRQTYTWMRCIDDPENRREKKTGEMSFSPLPKEVFDLYKSSSLHTMKVRTPRIVWVMLALLLAALALAFIIPHRLNRSLHPTPALSVADVPTASDTLRQKDFAKWMQPRVSGIPWTAPMFDKLTVKADPRLYCVAVDDGRCSCVTEQGTDYDVPLATCRVMVHAGGVYNPFIAPPESPSKSSRKEDSDDRQTAALRPVGRQNLATADLGDAGGAAGLPDRQTAKPYTPPEYQHFDPTPIPGGDGQ